jgi:hypothetical protein
MWAELGKGASKDKANGFVMFSIGQCIIETHRQCQGHIEPHHSLELGDEP